MEYLIYIFDIKLKDMIMATIKDKDKYDAIMLRIEELMEQVEEDTPTTDKMIMELDLLVELAEEYEDEHYSIRYLETCLKIEFQME